jgi:hypothetical protein
MTHSALAQPDRSRLRKMSLKTTINSQIQMMNKKNQIMDHSTWPVPNSAANTMSSISPSTGTPNPDIPPRHHSVRRFDGLAGRVTVGVTLSCYP